MATSAGKAAPAPRTSARQQDLEAEIAKLRAEMAKLAEQMAKTRDTPYSAARRAATEGFEQMKARARPPWKTSRPGPRRREQLTETVREKPITSLAIAAGVGFLFAVLMRR
jgi:ElaB/YqjD/DUF883 family membrane-anchored ribosome-binding protein